MRKKVGAEREGRGEEWKKGSRWVKRRKGKGGTGRDAGEGAEGEGRMGKGLRSWCREGWRKRSKKKHERGGGGAGRKRQVSTGRGGAGGAGRKKKLSLLEAISFSGR